MLAYNRFIGVTRLVCPATWAPQMLATIRWKLGQGAGRILRHAGHVVLRLVVDAMARGASGPAGLSCLFGLFGLFGWARLTK
jgi:hypothetical protein